jgi:hypothetical protein
MEYPARVDEKSPDFRSEVIRYFWTGTERGNDGKRNRFPGAEKLQPKKSLFFL